MKRLTGNFDELFDDANSFREVRLAADFRSDPEHLFVDQLNNTIQPDNRR